ncbi:glycosyltransferase [Neobacillus drentensis]|uniref:glycosyltransferase n=1 Tax=Neobacillus drentensis TaxID=220684 RepID=UPI0030009C96
MKPKVSIIVPIYNVEKYLSRCLDSLLAQTLKEIEVIAVNDGSTDLSLKILREYESQDNRIKVIDKQNGGVSSARNKGIQLSRGDYVGFVDPDDWVDPEMYMLMHKSATSEKADIVMCSYIREFGNHSKIKNFNLPSEVYYKDEEVKIKVMRRLIGPLNKEVANPELLDAWGTVWSKLYRADLIKLNNIKFMDLKKIGTNEDTLFNIEACFYAKSFIFINRPLYHYWRANSTSVTSGFKPNLLEQWIFLFSYIESFLKEKNMNEEFYLALNNRICLNTLGFGLNTISKDNRSSVFMKIKRIRLFLKENRIKHSFKQLDLTHFPIVWKVFYFNAKVRFAAGFYFMLICIEYLRKIIR